MAGFRLAANLHEPTRRLREEVYADADEENENDLQSQRSTPGHHNVGIEVGKVLDPVGKGETADILDFVSLGNVLRGYPVDFATIRMEILQALSRYRGGEALTIKNSMARNAPRAE